MKILWIEEQYDEYNPVLKKLGQLVGPDNVHTARTEEQGLAELQRASFDLVLLDLMLPRNDDELEAGLTRREAGVRILRQLRQNDDWETSKDCIVVVFTARGGAEMRGNVKELLGSRGFLIQKPADIPEVLAGIHQGLERVQEEKRGGNS